MIRGCLSVVLEDVLAQPVEGDRLEEPGRDNAVRIDIAAPQRDPAPFDHINARHAVS